MIPLFKVILTLILFGVGTAAVPTAGIQPSPAAENTPPPEHCRGQPRPLEDLVALVGSEYAPLADTEGATAESQTSAPDQHGTPAARSTVDSVKATMWTYIACRNAGDLRRLYELHTDRYLAQEQPPFTEEEIAELQQAPVPLSENYRTMLVSVGNAQQLPDGSVSAAIEVYDPFFGMAELVMIFVGGNEHRLIDRVYDVSIDENGGV